MYIPEDKNMLLCVINTKLRDYYSNLDSLCDVEDVSKSEIESRLKSIGYVYDEKQNQFI